MSEVDGAGSGAPPRTCPAALRGAAARRPRLGVIAGVLLRHRLVIGELSAVRGLLNLFFLSGSICFGLLVDKVFIHQSRSSLLIILVALVVLAAVEALLSAHAEETARILRTPRPGRTDWHGDGPVVPGPAGRRGEGPQVDLRGLLFI